MEAQAEFRGETRLEESEPSERWIAELAELAYATRHGDHDRRAEGAGDVRA